MKKNVQIPIPRKKIPHINFISIDNDRKNLETDMYDLSFGEDDNDNDNGLLLSDDNLLSDKKFIDSPEPNLSNKILQDVDLYIQNLELPDNIQMRSDILFQMRPVLCRPSFRIDYELSELIHKGENASVFRAISYSNHQIYAIKICKTIRDDLEYNILQNLNHPNIIKVYQSYDNPPAFVMEYIPQDLFSLLNVHKGFIEESEAITYTTHIANALSYIHSKGIMHRDIKPENIVIDEHNIAKLIDFDLCTMERQSNQGCGTIEYMAPEVLRGQLYDFKIDVWSLGIVFYEMLYSYTPFVTSDMNMIKNRILMENVVFTDSRISTPTKTLVLWMLEKNPVRRPSYDGLLESLHILKESYRNNRYIKRIKYLEDKIEDMKFLYYDKNIKKYRDGGRRKST